jgi:hypothetical protein
MGKNDSEEQMSDGTDAFSLSPHDSDLSDNITDSTSETSDSYSDDDEIDTDIEEQLCTLEHERQKILKKLKKFELEKKRKKMKKKCLSC